MFLSHFYAFSQYFSRLTGWDSPKRKLEVKELELKELELATASIKYKQAREEYSQVLSHRRDGSANNNNANYNSNSNSYEAEYQMVDGTLGSVQYFTKKK